MATTAKGTITFHFHGVKRILKTALPGKAFLSGVMKEEETGFSSIDYIFCSDDYLLELNKAYLNHDTLTDILTFTLSGPGEPIISEIYISVDRVKENAERFDTDFNTELHRVMIHGLLHLCGYEDDTPARKKKMRAREDYYLGKR